MAFGWGWVGVEGIGSDLTVVGGAFPNTPQFTVLFLEVFRRN